MDQKEINKIKRAVNKQLLSFKNDIEIIVDTREQQIYHILDYFQKEKITFSEEKLNVGDYSFFYKDYDFTDTFSIDRKKDVNEFIGNFFETINDAESGNKKTSLRFNNELERAKSFEYFSFCIEKGNMADIYNGNYKSLANKNAAIGRFETIKNNVQVDFIEGIEFGYYLLKKIYYWIRSKLINEEINKIKKVLTCNDL